MSLLYSLPPCGLSGSKSSGHWGSPLVVLPGLALPPTKRLLQNASYRLKTQGNFLLPYICVQGHILYIIF